MRKRLIANLLLFLSIIAVVLIVHDSRAKPKTYDFFFKGLHEEYVLVEPLRPTVLGLVRHDVTAEPSRDKLMHCTVSELERPIRFLDTGDTTTLKSVYLYCDEGIFRVGGVDLR